MVGAGTALTDVPSLTVRESPVPRNKNPHRILFDPNARTLRCDETRWQRLQEKLFSPEAATIVVYSEQFLNKQAGSRADFLHQQEHIHLLPIPVAELEPLPWLLSQLPEVILPKRFAKSSIQSVLLEGGPRLLAQFFKQQLVDVAHVFIAPYLGGGDQYRLTLPVPLIEKLNLQLVSNHAIVDERSDDVLIEYVRRDLTDMTMS